MQAFVASMENAITAATERKPYATAGLLKDAFDAFMTRLADGPVSLLVQALDEKILSVNVEITKCVEHKDFKGADSLSELEHVLTEAATALRKSSLRSDVTAKLRVRLQEELTDAVKRKDFKTAGELQQKLDSLNTANDTHIEATDIGGTGTFACSGAGARRPTGAAMARPKAAERHGCSSSSNDDVERASLSRGIQDAVKQKDYATAVKLQKCLDALLAPLAEITQDVESVSAKRDSLRSEIEAAVNHKDYAAADML